ncbi:MAG TPA: hypothetical protein VKQ05_10280 [Gemmatimonadales bacterium]|nr:hypothetical protein [Gemmatimonadales bacterium]
MMSLRFLPVITLGIAAAGCASYNVMWSAEHHAAEARRLERQGQPSEARAEWTLAANRARVVLLRRPRSRAADAALVLQAESLARAGACQDAAAPIAGATERATGAAARERVALAAAECAVAAGRADDADAALRLPLASQNADRRSRAEYLAGASAALRLDWDAALDHFGRSHEPTARGRGLVAEQRLRIVRAVALADLTPVVAELTRLVRVEHGTDEATHVLELLNQVMGATETAGARFHAAEVARDSLRAPALASEMLLAVARADTASLYAPKALIAALVLRPELHDSIVTVLDERYPASPYTQAFHGEPSVAYAAAEDSLARALGVATPRGPAVTATPRFDSPSPGPRGPRQP